MENTMQSDLPQGEIRLFANRPLRLNKALGLCIACTSGTMWITIAGESDDIFLGAGEQHTLGSNRLALVEAIGSGSIRLLRVPRQTEGILACRRRFAALERLILGDRI
jgi:hypothetical protein